MATTHRDHRKIEHFAATISSFLTKQTVLSASAYDSAAMALQTPLTQLLGIQHPIMLAGMNGVSHSDLAAAVSNAGPPKSRFGDGERKLKGQCLRTEKVENPVRYP